MVEQHVAVGSLRDGPQMGRDLIPPLAKVHLDHSGGVNGEPDKVKFVFKNNPFTEYTLAKVCNAKIAL